MQTIARGTVFPDDGFALGVQRATHRSVGMHKHDFSELVIVTDGHGIHRTGNREYSIHAGDAFVIHGDRSHEYEVVTSMVIVNVLFDLRALPVPPLDLRLLPGYHALFTFEPALRQSGRFHSRLRLTGTQMADVCVTLSRLEDEFTRRPPGWRFAAIALFMDLVARLSRWYSRVAEAQGSSQVMRLAEVVSYLEEHFAEPVRLDDLARMAHMSRSTLLRAFRLAFGRAPIEYLIRLRVDRATDLLRTGRRSLVDIARAVGFRDSNYLSRQFRAVTGMSPRAYRERFGRH